MQMPEACVSRAVGIGIANDGQASEQKRACLLMLLKTATRFLRGYLHKPSHTPKPPWVCRPWLRKHQVETFTTSLVGGKWKCERGDKLSKRVPLITSSRRRWRAVPDAYASLACLYCR